MIYGMLVVTLMWYWRIRKDLEKIGFTFNPYDPCITNRYAGEKQQTVRLHVDDMLVFCRDPSINEEFVAWCQRTYGELKPVKCVRGGKMSSSGWN